MEGSEVKDDGETAQDPGLDEAPTGAPPVSEDEGINESHPNEGEIEEAVKDVGLDDSPEDVNEDEGP